ncbi:MAG: hypothetical protein HYW07_08075 [Candidatus Latescibacteria bacterium]|nr:hypothetical protein [Candidatus Latescibacterota bacterium]
MEHEDFQICLQRHPLGVQPRWRLKALHHLGYLAEGLVRDLLTGQRAIGPDAEENLTPLAVQEGAGRLHPLT